MRILVGIMSAGSMRLLLVICFLFFSGLCDGQPVYTISELDINQVEGHEICYSYATSINELGQVAGYYVTTDGNYYTYLWDKHFGFHTFLESQHGRRSPVLNNLGCIVQTVYVKEKIDNSRTKTTCNPYYWDKENGAKKIPIPLFGRTHYWINGINDLNEVIGAHLCPDSCTSARITGYSISEEKLLNIPSLDDFYTEKYKIAPDVYKGYKLIDVGTQQSYGIRINNNSQMLGKITLRPVYRAKKGTLPVRMSSVTHSFIIDHESIIDLGDNFEVVDINDRGQVVGMHKDYGLAIWDSNKFSKMVYTYKGTLDFFFYPAAFNNTGQIVGTIGKRTFATDEACIGVSGECHILLDLVIDKDGWEKLGYVADINDDGQIVGYGLKNGKMTAFLLTPIKD